MYYMHERGVRERRRETNNYICYYIVYVIIYIVDGLAVTFFNKTNKMPPCVPLLLLLILLY